MLATAWRTPSLTSLVKRRKLSSSPPWKALKSSIENICFHLTSERERVRRFLKPRVIYIVLISWVIFSLTSASHRNMIPTLMSWEVEWAHNHWLVDIGLRVNLVEIVHRKKRREKQLIKMLDGEKLYGSHWFPFLSSSSFFSFGPTTKPNIRFENGFHVYFGPQVKRER